MLFAADGQSELEQGTWKQAQGSPGNNRSFGRHCNRGIGGIGKNILCIERGLTRNLTTDTLRKALNKNLLEKAVLIKTNFMEGEKRVSDWIRDRVRYLFKIIKKDLPIKLTAVLLAILLWFIVLNINNPYKEKSAFVELDVKNENVLLEKNIYLVNKNYRKTVEVIVRGRQDIVDSINPADFSAVLDFSKVKSVNDKSIDIDGPYYAKNDKQITVVGMNPKTIALELENIAKADYVVNLELKGTPKASYKVISAKTEPEVVTIQDRESIVNTINEVKALVDVSNIDRDRKVINNRAPYNESGRK